MDLRTAPRFPTHGSALLTGDHASGEGTLLNLSASGCAVQSTMPVRKGAYLELALVLTDQETPVPIELARVRWVSGVRFGLHFLAVGDDVRLRLDGTLALLEKRESR